ncbi:flavoprotein [Robertmurraya massiliosenegalensis]|uniref:flavoprotein n=1 Tax=Robertmurraya massiliosenegalensis TaxID=1287657 RepID=UPI00031501D4|nr:flavoprotein [Robertmurraya massiliosenegalensis]
MNIEELVRNLLQNLLPERSKKILIFLSGGSVNTEILLKVLAEFDQKNYELVLSDSGKKMIPNTLIEELNGETIQSFSELEKSLNEADFVLIPIMTRNTLSKVALGIADNLVTTGIARALMMGKEVLAVKDSFDSNHPINRVKELARNQAYNEMLKSYETCLEQFGVKFIPLEEFKSVLLNKINPSSERINAEKKLVLTQSNHQTSSEDKVKVDSSILTAGDIRKYEQHAVIQIKPSTIVTPLAKDFISDNQMKIEITNE